MNYQSQNKATLYLIPNLLAEDTIDKSITPQVKEVITKLDIFLAENIKSARRFISALKIGKKIEELTFSEMSKRTSEDDLMQALEPLFFGSDMGVISEAGCPGVADPGALAVKIAHENNNKVVPLVGPSSFLLALMASGLSGQAFTFNGYLPIDKKQRQQAIRLMERNARQLQQTQIFMDTPYRNNQLFHDLLKTCSMSTYLCVAVDITGKNEWIKTLPVGLWKRQKHDFHKRPAVFLIGVE
jgi:16S rRNA (cytidine1402-2'-O)-methyltransferase